MVHGRAAAAALAASILAMLLGATPCAAWSPPKRDTPAEKTRGCPEMGEGYVRLPGSDVCVRVGGLVRVEGAVRGGGAR